MFAITSAKGTLTLLRKKKHAYWCHFLTLTSDGSFATEWVWMKESLTRTNRPDSYLSFVSFVLTRLLPDPLVAGSLFVHWLRVVKRLCERAYDNTVKYQWNGKCMLSLYFLRHARLLNYLNVSSIGLVLSWFVLTHATRVPDLGGSWLILEWGWPSSQ